MEGSWYKFGGKLALFMRFGTFFSMMKAKQDKMQGLSQATPFRQSHTAIGIVPLKKRPRGPSKFREKTQKEAHTERVIAVQKLQAETERGKYILSHL